MYSVFTLASHLTKQSSCLIIDVGTLCLSIVTFHYNLHVASRLSPWWLFTCILISIRFMCALWKCSRIGAKHAHCTRFYFFLPNKNWIGTWECWCVFLVVEKRKLFIAFTFHIVRSYITWGLSQLFAFFFKQFRWQDISVSQCSSILKIMYLSLTSNYFVIERFIY